MTDPTSAGHLQAANGSFRITLSPSLTRFPAMGPKPCMTTAGCSTFFFAALYRAFGLIALRFGSGVRIRDTGLHLPVGAGVRPQFLAEAAATGSQHIP